LATSTHQRQCVGRSLVPQPGDQRQPGSTRDSTELAEALHLVLRLHSQGLPNSKRRPEL